MATGYLEAKVEVAADNNVRGKKVNVKVYTSIAVVVAVVVVMAEVAVAVERIAVAKN